MHALFVIGISALCAGVFACNPTSPPPTNLGSQESASRQWQQKNAPTQDETAVLSESAARQLLATSFREANLRVVWDCPIVSEGTPEKIEFTLDGCDPDRQIGFEYVSAGERDTDLQTQEIAHLPAIPWKILIVQMSAEEALMQKTNDFLARTLREKEK